MNLFLKASICANPSSRCSKCWLGTGWLCCQSVVVVLFLSFVINHTFMWRELRKLLWPFRLQYARYLHPHCLLPLKHKVQDKTQCVPLSVKLKASSLISQSHSIIYTCSADLWSYDSGLSKMHLPVLLMDYCISLIFAAAIPTAIKQIIHRYIFSQICLHTNP